MAAAFKQMADTFWQAQRVKRLVRKHLGAGAQCLVSVQEGWCTDPVCEGPVTEIRIVMVNFKEIRRTVHKRAAEIAAADVGQGR